ncbi:amino acid ABC transporter permease [Falsochrobactrum sp. TDYN1]|uniref:Glutamate/aspartate import permease protein GltK n=1 Tax=Falsochrobactrum tianjinense TaxID=2706015 RepID=A0A949PQQ5_9HYPH|nr:amino acid ABC transporter permease [Falsochrobactrum sp. TDYN1]MBV2145097.1 amino acid ABC transporter permease [Falsochrobactrum sp. TDYN1]
MYSWDFQFLWNYRYLFIEGIGVTIGFTAAIVVFGIIVGLIAGLMMLSRFSLLRFIAAAYIELFRCTPLLVQLIWMYYALPILSGIELSGVSAGLIALSLYGGAFYAEIIRGGVISIDIGQSEAGMALGMTPFQIMRRVILPQALKRMAPPMLNQSIIQLKNTSLISIIAVPDLLYQGQIIAHDSYKPLEVYTAIALAYLAILFPLTVLARYGERKLLVRD